MFTLSLLATACAFLTQTQSPFVAPGRFDAAAPPPSALLNHGPSTSGGGVSTISGETLARGRWSLDWRTDYTDYDEFSLAEATAIVNGGQEHVDSLASSLASTLALSYGLTEDFQIGAQTGWYQASDFLDVHEHHGGPVGSDTGDPAGLMDLWLQGKYRVMQGSRGHLAVVGGFKLPTGDHEEELDGGHHLDPSSQPGTGAVDYQAGVAYSRYLTAATTLDASALYTLRGEHDDFTVGDRVDLGVAVAHRLSGATGASPGWTVFGELVGVLLAKDEEGAEENPASGGTILYLTPGLRYRFSQGVALSVAPSLPLTQDWNGEQVETGYKLTCTVSFDW